MLFLCFVLHSRKLLTFKDIALTFIEEEENSKEVSH